MNYSEDSFAAVKIAIDAARQTGAHLIFFHAIHLNLSPYGPANVAKLKASLRREAAVTLNFFRGLAAAEGVRAESIIEEGRLMPTIVKAASQHRADLIILASHTPNWWKRLFTVSLAERLAAETTCAVLVLQHEKNHTNESNKFHPAPSNLQMDESRV